MGAPSVRAGAYLPRPLVSRLRSWLALWVGLLALVAWIRWPSPWWLLVAAAAALVPVLARAAPAGWRAYAAATLLLAVAAGFVSQYRLTRLAGTWTAQRVPREAEVTADLRQRLDALLERGERAAAAAAGVAAAGPAALAELEAIRRRYRMSAVALYDASGRLLAWAGDHRGPVPQAVQLGQDPYIFAERPLFSYLYFTVPIPERGGTAVAAALMRAAPARPRAGATGGFAAELEAETGERLVISRAERAAGAAVWDLRYRDRTLLSVSLAEPSLAAKRASVVAAGRRIVAGVAALALLLLTLGWQRTGERPRALPAAVVVTAAAILPLGDLLGVQRLFGPALFLLPGPVGVTLGRLLAVGAAAWLLVGWLSLRRAPGTGLAGAVAIAAGFPLVLWAVRAGASLELLAGSTAPWLVYHLAAVLLLGLVALTPLLPGPGRHWTAGRRRAFTGAGVVLAALGCAAAVVAFEGLALRGRLPPYWIGALWAVPAVLLGEGLARRSGWRGRGAAVLAAGWLAVTAALPWTWGARTAARMQVAERELGALGTPVDPYLEFLFRRFEATVDSLEALEAGNVELLYGGWVTGGLAAEGYPMWLTLWSPGDAALEELPIGVAGARPPMVDDFLAEARTAGRLMVRRYDRIAGVHYLAYVPLADGAVISVAVPPRRRLAAWSALAPVLGLTTGEPDPLTLVALPAGVSARRAVQWVRTERGWQGETRIQYPEGVYHAHYLLPRPASPVLVARAFLVLLLDLAPLLGLWAVGRAAVTGLPAPPDGWRTLVASFRARVTLALFVFFLVPTGVFGTLAYRTLAGAGQRTARALAERAVDEAAARSAEVGGALELLARRVGAELLRYRAGELEAAATRELVELGFYGAWLPPRVHERLASGEAAVDTEVEVLGEREYVVAYRRLPDGPVLASPAPLLAGATAVREGEVAHVLAFAIALGAALSLALALGVGRMLAGPIGSLRAAAQRVGRGRLAVRLPEERADEFGTLFAEFNRMVRRLRRARRALLLATRRTEAIMQAGATGVVALDAAGRVTLVNPPANELLGGGARMGERLPVSGGLAGALSKWLAGELPGGPGEGGTELQMAERRVRVRMRPIAGGPEPGGIVLNLEDVTDELRSERILAWGEMARHVAHEVKNPLTPIKLSVQHVRRAYEDRRPDFPQILSRNVDAVLREIDRLASIVRGLSRFAAPGEMARRPLEPVDLRSVVEETLGLYAGGGEAVSYVSRIGADVPPVSGRTDEMREVLVNLLENARAAIGGAGTIAVEARVLDSGVELAVRDDGVGIPPELLPHIFDPRFSTRSTGSGLGLAIVRRLVESWGGEVTAESGEGRGTVVRARLWRWTAPPEPPVAGPGVKGAESPV